MPVDDAGDRHAHVIDRPNTASSSESRLTVTRPRPAAARARGLPRQQGAVGGHGQVVQALDTGEQRHQPRQVPPEQRLATGQPDLGHAVGDEQAGQRAISSNVSRSERGRNWKPGPNTSRGMQ